jgi:putative hydrolase of the HAD superfamily
MIRAIVYDAVGTLIHVQPSVAALYVEIGQSFGSKLDIEHVCQRFPRAFARQDELDALANWRTSEARERQRWRDIVREVLDDVADADACFEAMFDRFRDTRVWACDARFGELFDVLQARGIRQAVASNFDARLHGLIQMLPPLQGLTPISVSSEIGWRKPAPEFFAHVIETLAISPSEILFVGDDRANDYDAAKRAGIQSVLLDPRGAHLDIGEDRVNDLGEVLLRVQPPGSAAHVAGLGDFL